MTPVKSKPALKSEPTTASASLQIADSRAALTRLSAWFETLTVESLLTISTYYCTDAYFKDPFNEVNDLARIQHIFSDMFKSIENARFIIIDQLSDGHQGFLTWRFEFRWGRREMTIFGSSHIRFDHQGKVCFHRDYWDAAEELYEKLPVLGFVLRHLKKRAQG